jgi:membrane-associated phospholipid phosphatase
MRWSRRKPSRTRRLPPVLRARGEVKRLRHPLVRVAGDLDQSLLRTLRTRGHDPGTEALMKALGRAGEWAAIWVGIGGLAAVVDGPRRGRWAVAAGAGPAAVVVNFAVKLAVGRERPLIEGHPPLARAPSKLSFPSAHATSSLAAATALGQVEPRARPALLGLAAAICISRPYLGMHYPSDVLAGALLGAAIGASIPGLGGPDTEARLIDLVAAGRAHPAEPSGSNGAGPQPDAVSAEPTGQA